MKTYVSEFLRRGFASCGFGPIILAILYLIFQQQGNVKLLTVNEVCLGIFSLSILAFIAGGMNVVYQIERLPLMLAILIHGGVLYVSYLATYLVNGWLARGILPIVIFSGIFVFGYLIIWIVICTVMRKDTARVNEMLKKIQHNSGGTQRQRKAK